MRTIAKEHVLLAAMAIGALMGSGLGVFVGALAFVWLANPPADPMARQWAWGLGIVVCGIPAGLLGLGLGAAFGIGVSHLRHSR